MRKKEIIDRLAENCGKIDVLETRLAEMKETCAEYEKRILELENVVFALRSNVKEQKQQEVLSRKRKWLNSMPDETKGDI